MLNRFFGTQCVRPGCGHHSPKGSEFCEKCGISLGFSRPAILDGNRWSPAPDELAAFFKFKATQGFFTKTLHVPPGMKAWVLQGDDPKSPTLQLEEGEHTTETLFQRLNNYFRSAHGEVLVVRTDSLPVALSYPDVLSAELLPMQVAATMMLSVGDVHAFRRRFMLQDGVVTTANLADILRGSVRQALAEVIGARHVDEMAADPLFRDKLDAALRKKLDPLLADLGLALMQVSEITLCHEALDEQNRLKGRLWLVRREMQVHDAHDKSLDEIYDQRQWAAIKRREAEIRRRRHEATLSKDEAEIAQTLRLLDQEKYQQIADAQTREQAIRMGAADEIGRLEQEYAGKRRHREKQALGEQYRDDAESEDWKNLQALARIKCDGERRAAEITASSLASFESERVERELEKLRIQGQLDALALVHDAAERQERELALRQQEQERVGLMRDLARRQHEAALVDIDLMVESKQANAARIQAWEEELLIAKVRKLKDEAAVAASDQRIEPTRKWMALKREQELARLGDKLQQDKLQFEQQQAQADAQLTRDLDRQAAKVQAERAAAEDDRARLALLGSLPEELMVSLTASGANVNAVVEVARIKAFKAMSPEQIKAAQGGRSEQPMSQGSGIDSGAFLKAMTGEIGALIANLGHGQTVTNDQSTGNLMRAHEGSRQDLVRAMEIMRDIANGRTAGAASTAPPAAPPAQGASPTFAYTSPTASSSPAGPAPAHPSDACHQCNMPAAGYQLYCVRCGTRLHSGRPAGQQSAPLVHKCPQCGELGMESARYCWCCRHQHRT